MSRPKSNSQPNVVQEGLHHTQEDGKFSKAFNPNNGKWEVAPTRQEMAFDLKTGKLLVRRTDVPANNPDSTIAISMAAAGFFIASFGAR